MSIVLQVCPGERECCVCLLETACEFSPFAQFDSQWFSCGDSLATQIISPMVRVRLSLRKCHLRERCEPSINATQHFSSENLRPFERTSLELGER